MDFLDSFIRVKMGFYVKLSYLSTPLRVFYRNSPIRMSV